MAKNKTDGFDLIILGGGPAGYLTAERAGARGKSVALVTDEPLGGVCLNAGCIPTKTFLYASKTLAAAGHSSFLGVSSRNGELDFSALVKHKQKTVTTLQKGIGGALKRSGVEVATGTGEFRGPGHVVVTDNDGKQRDLHSRFVLLATGSSPAVPPVPGLQDVLKNGGAVTSTEALSLQERPDRVVILGGGYIGLEFATFFAQAGTEVTVVEMMPTLVPTLDPDLVPVLKKQLPAMNVHVNTRVTSVSGKPGSVKIALDSADDKAPQEVQTDLVLVAAGRRPRLTGLNPEITGLAVHRGAVLVDDYLQTNLPGVYAAGDCTGRSMLAHAAYRMGEVALDHMFRFDDSAGAHDRQTAAPPVTATGGAAAVGTPHPATSAVQANRAANRALWPNKMKWDTIPWVVFTAPEMAGCGLNAEEAHNRGIEAVSVTVPLRMSGRYLAEHPREQGQLTLTAERGTGRVIGARMIGTGVSELIHTAAILIEMEVTVRKLRTVVFPHPTLSEVLRDAAWAIDL